MSEHIVNTFTITLEHVPQGTVASTIVKDSAGEYKHKKMYQGYDDETVLERFAQEADYLETF